MITPERSLQQRYDALRYGNEIRLYRAQLKRDIAAAKVDADEALVSSDPRLDTMKVMDLLRAVPGLGKVKINLLFRANGVSSSKTVAGLSPRQRGELLVALRTHRARSGLYQARRRRMNGAAS